jgi:hypothetical protein
MCLFLQPYSLPSSHRENHLIWVDLSPRVPWLSFETLGPWSKGPASPAWSPQEPSDLSGLNQGGPPWLVLYFSWGPNRFPLLYFPATLIYIPFGWSARFSLFVCIHFTVSYCVSFTVHLLYIRIAFCFNSFILFSFCWDSALFEYLLINCFICQLLSIIDICSNIVRYFDTGNGFQVYWSCSEITCSK